MSYSKEEMIDQVYIKVTGGSLTEDINVEKPDIEKLLGAAIAAALKEDHMMQTDQRIRESRLNKQKLTPSMDTSYYVTYRLTPKLDEERKLYYIIPPSLILRLPNDKGAGEVRPLAGPAFQRIKSYSSSAGLIETGVTFTFYEKTTTYERIYVINMDINTKSVLFDCVLDVDALDYTDTLPIPQHLEELVFNKLVNHFLQQREIPDDEVSNDKDVIHEGRNN